jgi:RNA polymerase sigma-70 factor (ECF subfamily)
LKILQLSGRPKETPTTEEWTALEAEQSVIETAQEETTSEEAVPADEAALVAQARHDPAAFGVLYERYVDRIYAYIYHRVGNVQDTEDLTARTFYRALDKLDTYEDRGLPFSAWLFRIAHNLVANWHRDRGRRRFLSLDRIWSHSREGDTPEAHVEKAETHDALWAAINRLPGERRDLLLYKFSSRLSNLEIGQLMDKSEGAIKSLYFRTLAALRKDLEAVGWGDSATAVSAASGTDEPDAQQESA